MVTILYSKLSGVLLSAVVLMSSVGWCCAHTSGSSAAGNGMGSHVHHGSPSPGDTVAKTSSPTHQGSDPSHAPNEDDSGCQDKITMLSTDFDAGTVYSDSGSYYQNAPAFTLSQNQKAWLAPRGRVSRGLDAPADIFRGDSLRALSRLITV
jgi:hypothetical protein